MAEPAVTAQTWTASLPVAGARSRAIADALGECLDPSDAAVTLYEVAKGDWSIALHFAAEPDAAALRALVADVAGDEVAAGLTLAPVVARDWVAASLAGLAPVRAGRLIVHGAHDRARLPARAIAIEVEAALAFGTGHHGTTRGCLLALDHVMRAAPRLRRGWVLDVGTGSGVLAIAAAKALRRRVLASDIDRSAVRIAAENAHANGVRSFVETIQANGVAAAPFWRRRPYALVFANILLAPLQRLAAPLAHLTAPGSLLVLSGLLAAHANAALAAYRAQGLRLVRRIELDGWTTLVLIRGGRAAHENARARVRPGGFTGAWKP